MLTISLNIRVCIYVLRYIISFVKYSVCIKKSNNNSEENYCLLSCFSSNNEVIS